MSDQTTTKQRAGGIVGGDTSATALATIPVEERSLRGLEIAEELFTPAQREQVAALLAVPADSPALMPYLALCVAEGFSPWANHVWLIPKKVKIPATDGEPEREETKHLPAVGRDGLLHKARQSMGKPGGYAGLQYAVVCERDTFEVEFTGDPTNDPKVLHRFRSKPTEFDEGESPDRYRGKILGAWAKLYLNGLPPMFYFASLREHGRLRDIWAYDEGARRRRPLFHGDAAGTVTFEEFAQTPQGTVRRRPIQEWEGAWDYLSTMILKAAQSYVIRIGLGVTGFVPVDELRSVEEWSETPLAVGNAAAAGPAEFDFEALPVDEDLRERLQRAIDTANEQDPFAWGPAKCEMVLTGRTEDQLREVVEDIERENDLREKRLSAMSEEEVVTDAEVVEENAAQIDRLRSQEADLQAGLEDAEPGSEEHGRLTARLDQVTAELRRLGGDTPGQGSLGV